MTQNNLEDIDPNYLSRPNGNFFGLPYTIEESNIVFLPVPWDVTTSYQAGAADGPQAILDASLQVEWYDHHCPDAWKIGHGTIPIDANIREKNKKIRYISESIIAYQYYEGNYQDEAIQHELKIVNDACIELNNWVYNQSKQLLHQNKLIGVIGGDHSVPLGLMKALEEVHNNYGILQIDAHADLRQAYEGFTYSHASIMSNALELDGITDLVQVGIRDICEEELTQTTNDPRISIFHDWQLKTNTYQGISWDKQCQEIIAKLPEKVYISFDIDGLDPRFCPHTGTPVPGGLDFSQAVYLIQCLVAANKTIIGFDLSEVAPCLTDQWDGNVGARLIYKISNFMYLSQK